MGVSKIVIATTNQGKLQEIKYILSDIFPKTEFLSLEDLNCDYEVLEDKESFTGNAIKKAQEYYKLLGYPCIADDSGLCIEAYDGWPGVKTARFLDETNPKATPRDRNIYILEKMKDLTKEQRKAQHITAMAFALGKETTFNSRGITDGYIATEIRGNNSFGFDEIFELENGLTQAEISNEEKNEISSRQKALVLLKKKIRS